MRKFVLLALAFAALAIMVLSPPASAGQCPVMTAIQKIEQAFTPQTEIAYLKNSVELTSVTTIANVSDALAVVNSVNTNNATLTTNISTDEGRGNSEANTDALTLKMKAARDAVMTGAYNATILRC